MINHIDIMLCRWGEWSIRQAAAGVGYPSISPMFRDMPRSDVFRSFEPIGAFDHMDMDDLSLAVSKLPSPHREIVICHYQHSKTWNDTCRKMKTHKKALARYLDESHRKIMYYLDESKNS